MIYRIYDHNTGLYLPGYHASRAVARKRADRLDAEYGAYRYCVRECEAPTTVETAAKG